jgi:hypothetical protein
MAKADVNKNLNKYITRIEAAEKHRNSSYKELWERCYKRYRNYVDQIIDKETGKPVTDRSNISIPYTFVQVETILPRLVETLFASRPYVRVIDRKPSQLTNAQNMETLLDWQMCERMDMTDLFNNGLKELCIYGTSIAYTGWKWKQKEIIRKQPAQVMQTDPETGEPILGVDGNPVPLIDEITQEPVTELRPVKENEIVYDDPEVKFIDLGLFFVDPNAEDVDDARYCGHDEFVTKEYLDDMVEQGVFKIDWKKVPKDKSINQPKADRMSSVGLPLPDDQIEEFSSDNLYRLTHYWEDDKHVAILNRAYIAMESGNPFWHKSKPYRKGVYTLVPHEFYGMGIVEMMEDLQDELNTERNMRIDYRAFLLRRMFKVRRDAGINKKQLKWKQGGIIEVESMDDVEEMGLRDVSGGSFTQESMIKQDIQDATGAQDVVMGTASTRETATTTMTKDNNASMRFRLSVSAIEKRLLCGIARQMMQLNQQFIDAERVFRLTGGMQVNWKTLTPEEIQGEFDLIAAGSSVEPMANREAYKQRMVELYGVVAADPFMQQFPIKRRNLLKKILESFDIKDVEAILPTDQEVQSTVPQTPVNPGGPPNTTQQAAPSAPNMPAMQEGGLTLG